MTAVAEVEYEVDLSSEPRFPENIEKDHKLFVIFHQGAGIVKVNRQGEDLLIDGEKVLPILVKVRWRRYYELRGVSSGKRFTDGNIFNFLNDHPELIPANWPHRDEDEDEVSMLFFGTLIQNSDGYIHVFRLHREHGDRWDWGLYWGEGES